MTKFSMISWSLFLVCVHICVCILGFNAKCMHYLRPTLNCIHVCLSKYMWGKSWVELDYSELYGAKNLCFPGMWVQDGQAGEQEGSRVGRAWADLSVRDQASCAWAYGCTCSRGQCLQHTNALAASVCIPSLWGKTKETLSSVYTLARGRGWVHTHETVKLEHKESAILDSYLCLFTCFKKWNTHTCVHTCMPQF